MHSIRFTKVLLKVIGCFLWQNFSMIIANNNFECLICHYLQYFNAYVTDLLLLTLFFYLEYSGYCGKFLSSIFYCLLLVTGTISCLHVLIAIFRLEVCDVTIMLPLCFCNRVYVSYCDVSWIVLGYSIAFTLV